METLRKLRCVEVKNKHLYEAIPLFDFTVCELPEKSRLGRLTPLGLYFDEPALMEA
jgi:hypothetical protein